MTNIVYRIQDADGRGPWKLGFSRHWVEDRDDHDLLIPWYREFGRVDQRAIVGMHIGCGCRTEEQLRRWFTPTEYARLVEFGYRAVQMEVGRILAESNIQCVFERVRPLRWDVEPFALYEIGVKGVTA
ncbi:hypothetical protein [Thauera aromatica]|uniref:Uncharacterized protein n=1 Tax=Thauera aromatica K172 TaxID=44139 RepID=A0A2R4BNZ8_THAAR|nr:hypothetical protein [Thauera aromatica]AVR89055.1 hypothetical protein Tharo_2152 [Thauera aromatica K172]